MRHAVVCDRRNRAQDCEIFKRVEGVVKDCDSGVLADLPLAPALWDAEGAGDVRVDVDACVKQVVQQLKAAEFLAAAALPLTTATVTAAHRILLHDATEIAADGTGGVRLCPGGDVRTESVSVFYGGRTHQYPALSPSELTGRLDAIVAAFNDRVTRGVHVIEAALRLAQSVVELHPFRNGNGRLCRLLFAAALQWQGLPLAVVLSSGHRKSRQHYVQALVHAQDSLRDKRGRLRWLRAMGVASVCTAVSNFASHLAALDGVHG
jgi:Fic family protein